MDEHNNNVIVQKWGEIEICNNLSSNISNRVLQNGHSFDSIRAKLKMPCMIFVPMPMPWVSSCPTVESRQKKWKQIKQQIGLVLLVHRACVCASACVHFLSTFLPTEVCFSLCLFFFHNATALPLSHCASLRFVICDTYAVRWYFAWNLIANMGRIRYNCGITSHVPSVAKV